MQPYRLIGTITFAIAALLYAILSITSSFDRVVHVATAAIFAVIAILWMFTYFRNRERSQ